MVRILTLASVLFFYLLTNAQIKSTPLLKMDSTAQNFNDGFSTLEKMRKGSRSRESIMATVNNNLPDLKTLYNYRIRNNSNLEGTVKVKFAIDEFGKVIYCKTIESTVNDSVFEKEIESEVNGWSFDKIDKPADVTEVIYPFVFKRDYTMTAVTVVLSIFSLVLSLVLMSQISQH
jgi:outer membrane biosynthesis protein TonB